jgi:hypothetical protein
MNNPSRSPQRGQSRRRIADRLYGAAAPTTDLGRLRNRQVHQTGGAGVAAIGVGSILFLVVVSFAWSSLTAGSSGAFRVLGIASRNPRIEFPGGRTYS